MIQATFALLLSTLGANQAKTKGLNMAWIVLFTVNKGNKHKPKG